MLMTSGGPTPLPSAALVNHATICGWQVNTRFLYTRCVKIKHKALRLCYSTGSTQGLPTNMVARIQSALTILDNAKGPQDIDPRPWRLHPLKGDLAGQWSMRITGNWRLVFRFEDGQAVDVDLIDYH